MSKRLGSVKKKDAAKFPTIKESKAKRVETVVYLTVKDIEKEIERMTANKKITTTNPKDILGRKKVDLTCVPPASIIYEAIAMEDGAEKYGKFNWRDKEVIMSIYLSAAQRHILSYQDGEELDPKSGKPHLAHAKADLGIIIDAIENGMIVDDRPPKGKASEILARYEKKN